MNELNLRVAALKLCVQPKQSADMRDARITLPSKWSNSQSEYVTKFSAAETCAEQMTVVKESFDEPQAFVFLADLLFACPLKHPVRCVLTRLFSANECAKRNKPTHTKESLQCALRTALRLLVKNIKVNADYLNEVFVSVSACLQNFAFGRDALAQEVYYYIPLLPMTLNLFWATTSNPEFDLSPTRRNEYYLFMQNVLRFHVNCMSEYSLDPDDERCKPLRFMDETCINLARNVDVPWDVRALAGLSFGYIERLFGDITEYLKKCQQLKSFSDFPIKAAALLVVQKHHYTTHLVQILDILTGVVGQSDLANNATSFLVYMSKHLHTYSKSLASINLNEKSQFMYCIILSTLMHFALKHIASSIESIRYMCANLLNQVLQHAKAAGQTKVIEDVYVEFRAFRMPLPSMCLMLQQLVDVMGSRTMLQNCPSVFENIFPTYLGLEDCVNTLFKCSMTAAHNEENIRDWLKVWCGVLIGKAKQRDDRLAAIERLLKTAVQLDPAVLPVVVRQRNMPFSSKLTAMLTARRHGQDNMVKMLMSEHIPQLNAALVGVNDATRILALCFVVETPRPSEPYTKFELDSIISYLQHNANNPSAHMRQLGQGLMQKAIKRLGHNLTQQLKDRKGLKDNNMLLNFLNDLMNILALNLFPTANYGRRWLSMRVLRDCIAMLERLGLNWIDRLPPQTLPFLEHCLHDSYEHNKAEAAHLLLKLQKCSPHKPTDMIKLLLSVRPADSVSGTYQLHVYCMSEEVETPLPDLKPEKRMPKQYRRHYLVLHLILQHLTNGIAEAQRDLTLAAKTNPLYGLLFASRHLINQLDLKKLAEEMVWRDYVTKLLKYCITISEIVLPVVGNESPEGYLPGEQLDDSTNSLSTMAQLILLCAWRSMKEISLIMGTLIKNAPLQQESKQKYLLSKNQVATIGEHFLQLLADIKHRGAFEQVYVGFTMLCRRFWQSDEPALNQLPPVWLQEAMLLVLGDVGKEICATRRSAGMPYMLQALICTELKLGTHETFNNSMTVLLDVCERRQVGPNAATARSHAMNIMRAFFRCSDLSDLVGEFVGRGIKCGLESLDSDEWNERNSATLMLAALIIRVFGVERARTETGQLHVRNRMTGRIFFTRYPNLFDYFYDALKKAAELAKSSRSKKSSGQTVQLEATLQLLSRLYPSPVEGTESSLNLSKFVPFLEQISYVHDITTRRRACQVLTNFMSESETIVRIRRLTKMLQVIILKHKKNGSIPRNFNKLHGRLLQLKELYRISKWKDVKVVNGLMYLLALIAKIIYEHDIFLFSAVLNVMVVVMQNAESNQNFGCALHGALSAISELDMTEVFQRCKTYAISPKFYIIFLLRFQQLTVEINSRISEMFKLLTSMENMPASVEQLKIDIWLYILIDQSLSRGIIEKYEVEHFNFDHDAVEYFKSLSASDGAEMAKQLFTSEEVKQHVLGLAASVRRGPRWGPGMASRVYALLAMLENSDLNINDLLNRSQPDAEPGKIIYITRILKQSRNDQNNELFLWLPLIRYGLLNASPKKKQYLRYRAAQLADLLTKHVQKILSSDDVNIIGNYIRLVLQLLVDESALVRECTSEMVGSYMGSEGITTTSMLPLTAEKVFLKHVLHNLNLYNSEGSFLIGIFNLVVEPFVSNELLANRFVDGDSNVLEEEDENEDEVSDEETDDKSDSDIDETSDTEGDIFDSEELNLYCEGLRIVSIVAKSFKAAFPLNKELNCALNALEKLCSYNSFGDQPIPPRIIS